MIWIYYKTDMFFIVVRVNTPVSLTKLSDKTKKIVKAANFFVVHHLSRKNLICNQEQFLLR